MTAGTWIGIAQIVISVGLLLTIILWSLASRALIRASRGNSQAISQLGQANAVNTESITQLAVGHNQLSDRIKELDKRLLQLEKKRLREGR